MTKTQIKQEIAGMFNEVRVVNGYKVARVCWKNYPWLVIEDDETFEDAAQSKFVPIEQYETSRELIEAFSKMKY